MSLPGTVAANGVVALPDGFVSHSTIPAEVYAKLAPKTRQTVKTLAALENGVSIAVPVDNLSKSVKTNRKGESVDVWSVKAHDGETYKVTEKIARQIAAELVHAKSKGHKGIVWRISHDAKNRLILTS